MRGILTRVLALALGMTAAPVQAGELHWRPAAVAAPQSASAQLLRPIASTPGSESRPSLPTGPPTSFYEKSTSDGSVLFFDDPSCCDADCCSLDACAVDGCAPKGRFWVSGEYLYWWMKGSRIPPL